LVGVTPKDLQVNISYEVRKIFECFFIDNLSGVVDAAIRINYRKADLKLTKSAHYAQILQRQAQPECLCTHDITPTVPNPPKPEPNKYRL
jgi:hypothetical protein